MGSRTPTYPSRHHRVRTTGYANAKAVREGSTSAPRSMMAMAAKAPWFERPRASAIVYAERDIAAFPTLDWPHWAADRPGIGSRIARGGPLCTVFACTAGATEARALAERRIAMILALTTVGLP